MTEILQVITEVGFPIGVCIICFGYIFKYTENSRTDALNREKYIMSQINSITTTLGDVAKTLSLINERIERLEEKVNE